jgi:hypothetical protein
MGFVRSAWPHSAEPARRTLDVAVLAGALKASPLKLDRSARNAFNKARQTG